MVTITNNWDELVLCIIQSADWLIDWAWFNVCTNTI